MGPGWSPAATTKPRSYGDTSRSRSPRASAPVAVAVPGNQRRSDDVPRYPFIRPVIDQAICGGVCRAPAACWWARTTVESTLAVQSSPSSASQSIRSVSQIRCHVPSNPHRRLRRYTVFHGPKRSGGSRHGTRSVPGTRSLRPPCGRRAICHREPDQQVKRLKKLPLGIGQLKPSTHDRCDTRFSLIDPRDTPQSIGRSAVIDNLDDLAQIKDESGRGDRPAP